MKIKSLAKGLLIMLISVSVLLSLTFSAYAQYNGGGGGNNDGKTIGGGGVYEADQGYRISLVNTDGSVYGGKVVDIELKQTNGGSLYDNANQFGSATASDQSSKGQPIKGGNPYENVIEAPKAMIWEGSKFVGNGNAVKAHMLQEDSNGDQNILAYAKQFLGLDDATIDVIKSGQLKIELEPIYNFPIYNSNGQYTGDRFVGSAREFIEDYVRTTGYNNYNQIAPALRGAVQAMILEEGDLGLEAMDPSELEKIIDSIIVSGDFSKLGLGLHIFNLGDTTPPQQPQAPTQSTGSIDITQSRITRSVKLSDIDDTLYNYQFTWEVPKFDESIKDHMYGYYAHSSGATITDKTNVVIVTEEKKPDDKTKGSGIIGNWTFPTHSDPIPEYRQTWSDRDWGDQSFSTVINLNPVEYRVTAVRQKSINDLISLISYRNNPNASAIIGATSTIKGGNKGDQRASNSGGSFAVDVEFKAGITDSTTVASHSDKFKKWLYNFDNSPKLDNAGNHKWTTETKTKTDTKTTTVKSGADKLQMTLNVNWSTYSGTQNTASSTPAAGLTQHPNSGKQETWLELNYGNVSFYPYVRMQFDTPTTQGSQVYVAGKYSRSFTANEYVGIIFNTSKNTGHSIVNTQFGSVKGKITLQSNQWSTHATAVKNAGSNCVLPGGAVLDLAILKDDRQTFTVESIKPILTGSGLTQVNATKTNIIELQCVY